MCIDRDSLDSNQPLSQNRICLLSRVRRPSTNPALLTGHRRVQDLLGRSLVERLVVVDGRDGLDGAVVHVLDLAAPVVLFVVCRGLGRYKQCRFLTEL